MSAGDHSTCLRLKTSLYISQSPRISVSKAVAPRGLVPFLYMHWQNDGGEQKPCENTTQWMQNKTRRVNHGDEVRITQLVISPNFPEPSTPIGSMYGKCIY